MTRAAQTSGKGKAKLGMAALSVLLSLQAQADTVVLENGDRLTGTVQLMDAGKLVLATDYAGELRIDWAKVVQLETDAPIALRAPGLPQDVHARLAPGGGRGQALPVPAAQAGTPAQPVELAGIERIVRPHALLEDWVFQGGVDISLDATHASSTSQNFMASVYGKARRDQWRHGLQLDYARNRQDGEVGTHNFDARYTADRFLTEKIFLQGRLRYDRDYVEDLSRQAIVAFGPGYQFWDDELGAFSVSTLLTHTRYKYRDGDRDHFQSLGLTWDYRRYFAGKQWQLFSQGEAYRSLSAPDNNLDANLGLRYSLTQWLSLYGKVGYNRVTTSGHDNLSERRYSVGLSATW